MSNQKVREMLDELINENYIMMNFAGEYFLSSKAKEILSKPAEVEVPVKQSLEVVKRILPEDWNLKFMSFIMEAKVPVKIQTPKGDVYYANKFNDKAMMVFKKAIESGVDYNLLLRSVQLYYKGNTNYKKTIGNYFVQGDWRSGYEDLKAISESGTSTDLINYIKQETTTNDNSGYTVG